VKKIGDILSTFIAENADGNFMSKARGFAEFFSAWASILAEQRIPQAAAHSRVVELERHVVMVETDHPGWVQILQTKQREILDALQRRFPAFDIRGIALRYAADPESFAPSKTPDPQAPPVLPRSAPEEKNPPIDPPVLSQIDDREFVDSLKRLRESIILRERSGKPR
jgi:hypothetical protein